jgi:anti-anti-sigma regulatory factor
MLRQERGSHRVVLIVEGRIIGEWSDVLEDECLKLIRSGMRVALDLSGVDFISRRGIEALDRLVRIGTVIRNCSPLIADLLEQEGIAITRKDWSNERIVPWKRRNGSDA